MSTGIKTARILIVLLRQHAALLDQWGAWEMIPRTISPGDTAKLLRAAADAIVSATSGPPVELDELE
jgi:hypothetical protein